MLLLVEATNELATPFHQALGGRVRRPGRAIGFFAGLPYHVACSGCATGLYLETTGFRRFESCPFMIDR